MGVEDNKAVVRAFVEAINERDWRGPDGLVAPGFVAESWAEWDNLNGLIQLGHFIAPG